MTDTFAPTRNGVPPLPPVPPRVPMKPPVAAKPPVTTPPSPFAKDIEAEIRRGVERHYAQIAEIEQLKTDVEHWRHRAELAEAELIRQGTKITQLEQAKAEASEAYCEEIDGLKTTIYTLQTQFESSAQIILKSYETLKASGLKTVTPQIEPPKNELA